jgi:hypothetical protein
MSEVVFPQTPWSSLTKEHRDSVKKVLEDAAWVLPATPTSGSMSAFMEALRVLTMAEQPGRLFDLPDTGVVRFCFSVK